MSPRRAGPIALALLAAAAAACDSPSGSGGPRFQTPVAMPTLGLGAVPERATSELWVRGSWAYSGTHAGPVPGNVIKVWNVSGNLPALLLVRIDGVRGQLQVGLEPLEFRELAMADESMTDATIEWLAKMDWYTRAERL